MIWRCVNSDCKHEVEWSEKLCSEKGEPICPRCDDDMKILETFTFDVKSDDERIVHSFEVNAVDADEADILAKKETEDFVESLHYEQQ